ncbi:MAG: G5 domain-containing protein [Clostridiales bacterium]|nr:G5 domain-containing protein [Clostridiales bacterium]
MRTRNFALCILRSKAAAHVGVFALTVLVVLLLCNIPATAATTYEINDGDEQYVISSDAAELSDVLDEAGIVYSDLDVVEASSSDEVVSLSITRRQYVTVVCDGVTTSTLAEIHDTVADVLEHLNIQLGEYDQVSVDPDTVLDSDIDFIEVTRASVSYVTESTPIAYSSVRRADTEMERGTEAVTTEGVEGSTNVTYRVIELDGQEPVYEQVATTVTDPVDEVISYGTKVNFEKPTGYSTSSEYITNIDDEAGTFTTSKGDTYTFSGTLTLNATAYTARSGAICSTGRLARVGVVAVDPDYIPYGTQMFIMSADGSFVYGIAIAGDCGSAIDNNDVDLYMTSRSTCINFGRRNVVAYVITGTVED